MILMNFRGNDAKMKMKMRAEREREKEREHRKESDRKRQERWGGEGHSEGICSISSS